jgi:hypothetical protein
MVLCAQRDKQKESDTTEEGANTPTLHEMEQYNNQVTTEFP